MHKLVFAGSDDGIMSKERLQQTDDERHDGHADDGANSELPAQCPEGDEQQEKVDEPHRDGWRDGESIEEQGRDTCYATHHHLLGEDKGRVANGIDEDADCDEEEVFGLLTNNMLLFLAYHDVLHSE